MGRMADARKRAKRGVSAAGLEPPVPEAPPAVTGSAAAAASAAEPKAAAAEPAAPPPVADFVFPSESPDEPAAGARMTLPSSGLAEEVLSQVRVEAQRAPAGAEGAKRIELPASGLAEDILARREVAAVAAPRTEPQPRSPAPVSPAAPVTTSGAHSLSFFAAPAQEQRVAVEATEHRATFYLDREEYGVDV